MNELGSSPPSAASGRVLAIDLGARRMGLAVSDPLRITAQGLPTAERRNKREDLNFIKSLARRHGASLIVVGNPLNMDGSAGPQSEAARLFATQLQRHWGEQGGQVQLWDERLTTVQAHRVLRESGRGPAERAASADQVAAMLLLQNFLDAERDQRDQLSESPEREG